MSPELNILTFIAAEGLCRGIDLCDLDIAGLSTRLESLCNLGLLKRSTSGSFLCYSITSVGRSMAAAMLAGSRIK